MHGLDMHEFPSCLPRHALLTIYTNNTGHPSRDYRRAFVPMVSITAFKTRAEDCVRAEILSMGASFVQEPEILQNTCCALFSIPTHHCNFFHGHFVDQTLSERNRAMFVGTISTAAIIFSTCPTLLLDAPRMPTRTIRGFHIYLALLVLEA